MVATPEPVKLLSATLLFPEITPVKMVVPPPAVSKVTLRLRVTDPVYSFVPEVLKLPIICAEPVLLATIIGLLTCVPLVAIMYNLQRLLFPPRVIVPPFNLELVLIHNSPIFILTPPLNAAMQWQLSNIDLYLKRHYRFLQCNY